MRWKLLSALWGECEPEARIRHASRMEDRDRVTARVAGAVATLAAYSKERDLTQAFVQALIGVELYLEERGMTFQELADEKAARLAKAAAAKAADRNWPTRRPHIWPQPKGCHSRCQPPASSTPA